MVLRGGPRGRVGRRRTIIDGAPSALAPAGFSSFTAARRRHPSARDTRRGRYRRGGIIVARHSQEARVEAEARSPDSFARLTEVRIDIGDGGRSGTLRLERTSPDSDEIRVVAACPPRCDLPRVVLAPEYGASQRVAAALESDRSDPPFRRALPIALWLLGA